MQGRRKATGFAVLVVVVAAAAACTQPTPPASVTQRVDVATTGAQANGSTLFTPAPSLSDDGRYVAFQSDASNLVPGDANGATDVFVRDRRTGTTTLVSVATGGGSGAGPSRGPSISGDGRYVVFDSGAPDLVTGDTNGTYDAFVRDLVAGTTTLISVDSSGARPSGASFETWGSAISDDGSRALFETYQSLEPGDTNGQRDVYLWDRTTGTSSRVSVGPGGAQIAGYSQQGAISGDGRVVAFETDTDGVVPADTDGVSDIFVHDLTTGVVDQASLTSTGGQPDVGTTQAALSDDGRYVVFGAFDGNLVPGDTDSGYDVFRRDRVAGTTTMVSVDTSGANVTGYSYSSASGISDDGRRIAFYTYGGTVPDANGYGADVFLRDVTAGTTTRLSVGPGNVGGDADSSVPGISGNGRVIGFWSAATNLVAGDTNGVNDVFVRALAN